MELASGLALNLSLVVLFSMAERHFPVWQTDCMCNV